MTLSRTRLVKPDLSGSVLIKIIKKRRFIMETRQDPYSYPEKEQLLLDSKNDHRAEVVLPENGLLLKSELPGYYK